MYSHYLNIVDFVVGFSFVGELAANISEHAMDIDSPKINTPLTMMRNNNLSFRELLRSLRGVAICTTLEVRYPPV